MVRRAERACVENSENDGFRSIIPASSFMTPLESRNEESMSRVRMFGPDKLSVDLSKQKWDQFKVVFVVVNVLIFNSYYPDMITMLKL